ncbi:YczE/YyaS/YitT family protein [Clostridium gasigenes]|uniref:Uncharacterized membrane protein YczE n=1 Tax=Clostridium gasigenes TaxID=94869 RepID=A0A1H0T3V3_9CLOT|nr:hypothetical protein [Clostridium gasigenes]MBB6623779.1 hypothetical protein [Clostridium gasigenes]MBU3088911.1 hypothetical protein [Clostridium gasigenes]MBU3134336.1 hypothetical protein [Clostridium gasigenes]MBU3137974.1 hypothetical protein [Clostridium gasigenes]NKF07942.1 hypothetical protein [Clostridium gasigenes]
MKNKILILIRLFVGFVFCASSTTIMLNSNLGLSPWDVFHQGVSNVVGVTIGQASIIVSIVFVIIGMMLGQKLGLGTILNMIIVGKLIDVIMAMNIIPVATNIISGIIMMIIGMLVMGFGCYLYIGCGLGCGPRDGVMIGLSKKVKKPIKYVRTSIEVTVLILGYILGGNVGVGTLISAIALGYSMQSMFKLFKFDAIKVNHKSLIESINF